jgi:hypothetical protein
MRFGNPTYIRSIKAEVSALLFEDQMYLLGHTSYHTMKHGLKVHLPGM